MSKKPSKKKPAKKSSKPSKPSKPISGQSGPKIDVLAWEKMNDKEKLVYQCISRNQKISLEDLAKKCFASKGASKSNSWARNSLRRLVRAGLVKKTGRGEYALGGKKLQHVKLEARKPVKKSKPKKSAGKKPVKAKSKPAKKKPASKKAASKKHVGANSVSKPAVPVAQEAQAS